MAGSRPSSRSSSSPPPRPPLAAQPPAIGQGPGSFTVAQIASPGGFLTALATVSRLAGVILLALWAIAVATDYSTGLIRILVQAQPNRIKLMTGKILALTRLHAARRHGHGPGRDPARTSAGPTRRHPGRGLEDRLPLPPRQGLLRLHRSPSWSTGSSASCSPSSPAAPRSRSASASASSWSSKA